MMFAVHLNSKRSFESYPIVDSSICHMEYRMYLNSSLFGAMDWACCGHHDFLVKMTLYSLEGEKSPDGCQDV